MPTPGNNNKNAPKTATFHQGTQKVWCIGGSRVACHRAPKLQPILGFGGGQFGFVAAPEGQDFACKKRRSVSVVQVFRAIVWIMVYIKYIYIYMHVYTQYSKPFLFLHFVAGVKFLASGYFFLWVKPTTFWKNKMGPLWILCWNEQNEAFPKHWAPMSTVSSPGHRCCPALATTWTPFFLKKQPTCCKRLRWHSKQAVPEQFRSTVNANARVRLCVHAAAKHSTNTNASLV